MDKLGRVIESNENGEVRKHVGHKGRTVYFVWVAGAGAAESFPRLSEARAAIGINPTPSDRAAERLAARHAADKARKDYVAKRNANHKGK